MHALGLWGLRSLNPPTRSLLVDSLSQVLHEQERAPAVLPQSGKCCTALTQVLRVALAQGLGFRVEGFGLRGHEASHLHLLSKKGF